MKLGRRRPDQPSPHPPLARYVSVSTLPKPPDSVDYSAAAVPESGRGLQDELGNGTWGDCTAAEYGHQISLWTGNSGALVLPTLDQTLAFYGACSGFVQSDPSTDRGADELTVLQVAKTLGLAGHTIQGAVIVDAGNPFLVAAGIWLLGGLSLCMELPDAWLAPAPYAPGFTWDLAGSPNARNGHCVLACGYDHLGVYICTWGRLSVSLPSRVTWRALGTYGVSSNGGSLFGMLSKDWLSARGAAPTGFDLEQIQAEAQQIGGAV